jgi:hypothetical protein
MVWATVTSMLQVTVISTVAFSGSTITSHSIDKIEKDERSKQEGNTYRISITIEGNPFAFITVRVTTTGTIYDVEPSFLFIESGIGTSMTVRTMPPTILGIQRRIEIIVVAEDSPQYDVTIPGLWA